ncbi:MAG: metallopeptidase TldD-related protein [Bacillota bacterium]|nr:metallopeptidase TldD-related protein [Bacillota bacterium]
MIKQIVTALKANPSVSGWLVNETVTVSSQVFYVMQKKETTRRVETREYQVAVYLRHGEQNAFVGSSMFAVSRKLTKAELARKIEEAVFAARFVKNKAFDLVKGAGKRTWKEKPETADPYVILDDIANAFFAAATPVSRFNALEAFHARQTIRILNSEGVDLTKTQSKIDIEAIPSHDGPERKVELIRMFTYKTVDLDLVKKDAAAAIADVALRYDARKLENVPKADVILAGDDVEDFLRELIGDFSYDGVYRKSTDKKIGDAIQSEIQGDALSIGWTLSSKADAFDRDGVMLAPVRVVEAGKLVGYYGSNQYAQYLNLQPVGVFGTIEAAAGKTTIARMKAKPHLEIIALSGIQIDIYSGYIGGEVRLAVWFDGKNRIPVSGFSFSGNIDKALSDLVLSKETVQGVRYHGPKCILLKGMDVL